MEKESGERHADGFYIPAVSPKTDGFPNRELCPHLIKYVLGASGNYSELDQAEALYEVKMDGKPFVHVFARAICHPRHCSHRLEGEVLTSRDNRQTRTYCNCQDIIGLFEEIQATNLPRLNIPWIQPLETQPKQDQRKEKTDKPDRVIKDFRHL